MPVTYTYPSNAALTAITPELIQAMVLDDPIFSEIFPIVDRNAAKLRWTIKDLMKGLMNLRGLGGEPTRVNQIGEKVYESLPGYYGEYMTIDETEMTTRSAGIPDNMTVPIDMSDLVAEDQEILLLRYIQRMRQICWLLAVNNTFAVPLPTGGIGHAETYAGQQIMAGILWTDQANSTPLKNLRSLQPQFGIGTSGVFGGTAKGWVNSVTLNMAYDNRNPNDIGGKRDAYGATINDLPAINKIFLGQNTPQLQVFDDGYIDDFGVFQYYLPTGKILVKAQRPGNEKPGEFQMTRNANNPGAAPGPYSFVDDRTTGPKKTVPPRLDVHAGFNGGPVVERPSQLVTLTVS